MNYIYGMTTLKALIELEIRALATITQVKATIYKSWKPLAEKWRLWVTDDTCTEYDATFVFDLPTLPEKVQSDVMFDSEYSFDLDDEQPVQLVLDNGAIVNLGYCECMTNAEFLDLVASHVNDQQFNLLPYGFDSPITLSEDNLYLMFWFEKYITDDYTIVFDDWLKDQPINGYQVAQWLAIFFYGFVQSVLLPYCLDSLDRVIQIAHNARFILIYRVTNDDSFVFIDIGETA